MMLMNKYYVNYLKIYLLKKRNKLPSFSWSIFKDYWNICIESLIESQKMKEKESEEKDNESLDKKLVITEKSKTTIIFLEEA